MPQDVAVGKRTETRLQTKQGGWASPASLACVVSSRQPESTDEGTEKKCLYNGISLSHEKEGSVDVT